ncbi:hypothetical protein BIV60_23845 [Bacillus sp. MUM 116]|uniref:CpaF family protein n=1 Tax=Bacillus sp. MUM 116 TaxID=1678002 RepID=UPI0008F57993|nr:ATPase, T2SS/T4P/T4SS family [Bacillus sp. MUM 116]OIK09457.1 hypothetical protein BIV60_23845 [Bacillus sp. MUM 116]
MGLLNQNKRKQIGGEAVKKASSVKNNSSFAKHLNHRVSCNQEFLFDFTDFCQLKQLLLDKDVSEVMVNGPNQVYCERKGKIILTPIHFRDNKHVIRLIEKMIAPIGRIIDESSPMVDARLPDGSHLNAIIPPLADNGPAITIRKSSKKAYEMKDLISFGTVTEDIAVFLNASVKARLNLFVSGGPGSGKTITLNAISKYIPEAETIGKTDRMFFDEDGGGDPFLLLQVLMKDQTGSLASGHSKSPEDMITRLETMMRIKRIEMQVKDIREHIAGAIDLIIHQARLKDGSRKIVKISEVYGMNGDRILLRDLFTFKHEGMNRNGKVVGRLVSTGVQPGFFERLKETGIEIPPSVFK